MFFNALDFFFFSNKTFLYAASLYNLHYTLTDQFILHTLLQCRRVNWSIYFHLKLIGCKANNYELDDIMAQAACVCHPRWRLQCVAGHCYSQLSVSLSFSFFLRLLLLTHFREEKIMRQKTDCWSFFLLFTASVRRISWGENSFPSLLEEICKKKCRQFYFFGRFFFDLRPAFGHGRLGHP